MITNLSSVGGAKNVLCRGLNFGVLPKFCKEEIKAEFDLCWDQLKDLPSASIECREECRSALNNMTYKYANTRIDKTGFPLDKDHLLAIKELK